jgi:choline dehydrogenase-like flavoprotein
MNPQSRGSINLQSSDPEMPPMIDFAFMSHPYDRRILIEGVRHAMQFVKTRAISKYWKSSINVPKSEQEQDIWVGIMSLCERESNLQ